MLGCYGKKGSSPEKVGNADYCFSEKLDALQKYMLRKSSSSVDIFILKKVAVPNSNYPKQLRILK